mmetsp:Transcript_99829/g.177686  ORF Transcript_99829/g.177686 Transcript_99829/m.177686 type:complete len:229 (+) Transcript_99829:1209-1895(+)
MSTPKGSSSPSSNVKSANARAATVRLFCDGGQTCSLSTSIAGRTATSSGKSTEGLASLPSLTSVDGSQNQMPRNWVGIPAGSVEARCIHFMRCAFITISGAPQHLATTLLTLVTGAVAGTRLMMRQFAKCNGVTSKSSMPTSSSTWPRFLWNWVSLFLPLKRVAVKMFPERSRRTRFQRGRKRRTGRLLMSRQIARRQWTGLASMVPKIHRARWARRTKKILRKRRMK